MSREKPTTLNFRGGGGERVNQLITGMMALTPASPVKSSPRAIPKGNMPESPSQESLVSSEMSSSFSEKDCIDLSQIPRTSASQRIANETEASLEMDCGPDGDSARGTRSTEHQENVTNAPLDLVGRHEPVQRSAVPKSGPTQRNGQRNGPQVELCSESSEPESWVVAINSPRPPHEAAAFSVTVRQSCAKPESEWSREDKQINSGVRTFPAPLDLPLLEQVISSSDKVHYGSSNSEDKEEWDIKTPSPNSIIPKMQHLLSSSDKGGVLGSANTSSEYSDSSEGQDGPQDTVDASMVEQTMLRLRESLQRGFLFGPPKSLQEFLIKIVSKPRDFGIYIHNQFNPSAVDGVMRYRQGQEFTVKKTIHHSEHKQCGVFLCIDNKTKEKFVLKKIKMHNKRLIGIEFLTQHNKAFLPKIYGVYKEKDFLHIFEEFIEGGTLLNCEWNLSQVRQFAETLLSAFHYLHTHDLAHCDVKLMNLMVRDPQDPESLVLIDFESAKHPQYTFYKGGHTVTYLPPWYDRLLELNSYNQLLKTADLWAIACVIIFFLLPTDRNDIQREGRGVWNQAMEDIKNNCLTCRKDAKHSKKYCNDCKKNIMLHIKSNGHRVLDIHLGHLLDANINDPDWKALQNVLKYLTDIENIEEKHIDIALSLVKYPDDQQA